DVAGPLTRSVTDGAKLFNLVAGHDPADPYTELGRGKREADYTAFLKADGLRGARLGVLGALTYTEDADPEIVNLFEAALLDLAAAGATIVEDFEIPGLAAHRASKTNFCARFRYDMHQYLLSLGDGAPFLDVIDMLEAGTFAEDARPGLEFFADFPLDVHPRDWPTPCPDFADHPGRQAFLADVLTAMDAADVDAILYPTWTSPPALITRQRKDYRGDNSQEVAPATGLPAVTVPMGFSAGNLPAGLQILARPYAEGLLFQYAYAFEQATMHRQPPPDYPELGE
ncbi:MAG: glutamyl-tRNA amidotransferase, partial [Proteobacteria bacterium]|nr:glutamyl-tRNA amidotransferase [Pseudomonadota bacterium]